MLLKQMGYPEDFVASLTPSALRTYLIVDWHRRSSWTHSSHQSMHVPPYTESIVSWFSSSAFQGRQSEDIDAARESRQALLPGCFFCDIYLLYRDPSPRVPCECRPRCTIRQPTMFFVPLCRFEGPLFRETELWGELPFDYLGGRTTAHLPIVHCRCCLLGERKPGYTPLRWRKPSVSGVDAASPLTSSATMRL